MIAYPINYMGDESILTEALYVKWSSLKIGEVKVAVAELKADLDLCLAIYDNISIISYLTTLLRAVALTA